MIVTVEIYPGTFRKVHMAPACGVDFCDDCMACLACDHDPCDDGGPHRWVINADQLLLDERAIVAVGLGLA